EGSVAKNDSGQGRVTPNQSNSRSPETSSMTGVLSKLEPLAKLLKWIVFAIFALVVGFYVIRAGLRFLAYFTPWAKNLLNWLQSFWQSLFGKRQTSNAVAGDDANPEESSVKPRPFALFRD